MRWTPTHCCRLIGAVLIRGVGDKIFHTNSGDRAEWNKDFDTHHCAKFCLECKAEKTVRQKTSILIPTIELNSALSVKLRRWSARNKDFDTHHRVKFCLERKAEKAIEPGTKMWPILMKLYRPGYLETGKAGRYILPPKSFLRRCKNVTSLEIIHFVLAQRNSPYSHLQNPIRVKWLSYLLEATMLAINIPCDLLHREAAMGKSPRQPSFKNLPDLLRQAQIQFLSRLP